MRIRREKLGRLLPGYVGSLTVLNLRGSDNGTPRRI